MIRLLDLILSILGIILLSPLMLIILFLSISQNGSPIYIQDRLGRKMKIFKIIKFRTMRIETPSMPTHKITSQSITHTGKILRKFKLDEIPQLFNVLVGQMSFVGPRPCLESQQELINLRKEVGLYNFRPGITGLAQIKRIDMSNPQLLVKYEIEMMKVMNPYNYFKYIIYTLIGYGVGDNHKNKEI